MTPELIAIVMVGVALAGVILASIRGVRQDMTRLESRLDGRIDALGSRLDGKLAALESRLDGKLAALESSMNTQLGELRERMARLEGVLDGLRESIVDRARAS